MKTFQVIDNKCHWDATAQFPTVESTAGFFPPDDLFVEAPDYVREGWNYVNGEFIEPESPVPGLVYDRETGMFYDPDVPAVSEPAPAPIDETALLRAQVAMLQEQQTFLEDCLLEMAEEVYA